MARKADKLEREEEPNEAKIICQTCNKGRETKSSGTQTVTSKEMEEELRAREIQEVMCKEGNYEGLAKILEWEWPEKVFRNVTERTGNPLRESLPRRCNAGLEPEHSGQRNRSECQGLDAGNPNVARKHREWSH